MSDRDPALEAAWVAWWNTTRPRHRSTLYVDFGAEEAGFRAGYHAALRSLGAGTPEAQAALRKLVKAAQRYAETSYAFHIDNPQSRFDHDHSERWLKDTAIALAALATPTEEGR